MQEVLSLRLESLALGLEDLYHSHNGAACLRSAEGMGLQDVVSVEARHAFPLPGVSSQVSMAAHAWLDLHRLSSPEAMMSWARARGMRVFGAGPRARFELSQIPIDEPLLLLFGSEKTGLLPETLAGCDESFRIPMYGFTESFNVSVSVGMSLSHLVPRVRAMRAEEGSQGDLPQARQRLLLARWCLKSVRASEGIIVHKLGL